MPSLKDIRRRIESVKKTSQITSAMKLVAGAKLKRATEVALGARPYQQRLSAVLGRVAERVGPDAEHPLLQHPDQACKALVVILTSDRGLCGAFNNGLLRQAKVWLEEELTARDVEYEVRVYGRKGVGFLDFQGIPYAQSTVDYDRVTKLELIRPLAELMIGGFTSGQYDRVYLVYNQFVNVLSQKPSFDVVLPLSVGAEDEGDGSEVLNLVDYKYEPSAQRLMGTLLPLFLRTKLLQAFLETEAGEYAARMTAMEAATRNADELIGSLTLSYNRARQAAITTEITEIVGGAEAL